MFKLMVGAVLVGILAWMVNEWRKWRSLYKSQRQAREGLNEALKELDDVKLDHKVMDVVEKVVDKELDLDKRQKKLNKKIGE